MRYVFDVSEMLALQTSLHRSVLVYDKTQGSFYLPFSLLSDPSLQEFLELSSLPVNSFMFEFSRRR